MTATDPIIDLSTIRRKLERGSTLTLAECKWLVTSYDQLDAALHEAAREVVQLEKKGETREAAEAAEAAWQAKQTTDQPPVTPDRTWGAALAQGIRDQAAVIDERDQWKARAEAAEAKLAAPPPAMPTREELVELAIRTYGSKGGYIGSWPHVVDAIADKLAAHYAGQVAEVTRERDEARGVTSLVLGSMKWTGDGYEWTGGEIDYRVKPHEAVKLMDAERKQLETNLATARRELSEARQELAEYQGDNLSRCCGCRFDDGKLTTECLQHAEVRQALEAERAGAGAMIEGKSPWDFACDWYKPDEIHRSIQNRHVSGGFGREDIPTDIESHEFSAWLTNQYRLAMNKGIEIGQRSCEAAQHAAEVAGLKATIDRLRSGDTDAQKYRNHIADLTAERDAAVERLSRSCELLRLCRRHVSNDLYSDVEKFLTFEIDDGGDSEPDDDREKIQEGDYRYYHPKAGDSPKAGDVDNLRNMTPFNDEDRETLEASANTTAALRARLDAAGVVVGRLMPLVESFAKDRRESVRFHSNPAIIEKQEADISESESALAAAREWKGGGE